jgi:flagellar hook-associated protein 3 FlgL
MTRITDGMMTRSLLRDLNSLKDGLAVTHRQLSSGQRITRPSDDPFGTGRAIGLRGELEAVRQHQRNVREATSWQDVTDGALGRLSDVVIRGRELLVRGANDTMPPDARAALATELETLIGAAKEQANVTYAGRYVLGGTAITTPPYASADDSYRGDAGIIAREIGPGVSLQVNVHASDILGGLTPGDGLLLDVLRDAAAALRDGGPVAMESLRRTDLPRLDAVLDKLNRMRSVVGATTNRLEAAGDRLAYTEETATRLLSQVESADMAETIMRLNNQQYAYEAALKAGAQIVQPSLLDFLR